MCSSPIWMSDEANAEIKKLLSSRNNYIDLDGRMRITANGDTVSLIVHNLTGEPVKRAR